MDTDNRIYVWDKFVRLFHWSLVLLFMLCYISGDEIEWVHVNAGYIITGLISLRIIWGLIGSRYAKFHQFIYSPRSILNYTKSLFGGKPKHYLGHNPLGGVMVLTMLLTLTTITFSGLKLYAVEEGLGPFASVSEQSLSIISSAYGDDEWDFKERDHDDHEEDFWEDIHEASANLMLFLIILHIAGVIISSRVHDESLVKAMINGYKSPSTEE
ncbi:cytochrome b/b6 domain-containing protein [uncultured Neptuniibacter sp.]|uniref:cytochrome b/b6 domain-containing protein n=1 Tax=uncultured Neptuniibacter sp. TaxID=502143 RepID=UPI002611E9D0|nr:cytochrome b/b6 domain-containing protein [uncultured Neptuniibacter sp.]